ncbi:GNAT family N-acetyltransferase [Flagellimonas myxillae]|uniref:GNAT family N-acetyltransferase n=1 Tax=Flagellimonas myxillae TaxID=2942214 RepID=UPI00201EF955|nr:GNAT family N-acetyltransferase [Muricauda myxillae]MCL6266952.1 GNAT family N-acetyltransferase [Muricauda myxillae]
MDKSQLQFIPLTLKHYQQLRATTEWEKLEDGQVEWALQNDLFSVCAIYGDQPIGMGRVVGDGAIYFYVQDVIVHTKFKGKGIGRMIMQEIEKYLNQTISHYAFVGLMAAQGVASFYHQFGYSKRPMKGPGMFKIVQK